MTITHLTAPSSFLRNGSFFIVLTFFGVTAPVYSQQWSGCYLGRDHLGHAAWASVSAERYGAWFEIFGHIQSGGTGQAYRFKADGHSGAGRLYSRHEYEAGAVYINVLDLSQSDFVLQVEGFGTFRFRRSPC